MFRCHRHPTEAFRRPRRAPVRAVLAAVLVLVVGTSIDASAQTFEFRGFAERHGRVQRELERTQELWIRVNTRAGQSNLPGVRELVEQARTIQVRAKDALSDAEAASDASINSRLADQHLRQSLSLTLRARDLTTRAARQLREELSQEESARRTIERAKQQLERAEGADGRLVSQARELVDRAEMQWRDGRFEQALRLAQNAVAVLSTSESRDEGVSGEDVAAALQRVRERLERARDRGADGARVQAIERLLDRAQEAIDAGRPREAAQRILSARRTLDQIDTPGRGDASRTEQALDRIDAQIERIQERFGDRLDDTARSLLRQAGQARDRAARALDNGDEDRAQQHIRAAADLLARLQRQAGRG